MEVRVPLVAAAAAPVAASEGEGCADGGANPLRLVYDPRDGKGMKFGRICRSIADEGVEDRLSCKTGESLLIEGGPSPL